MDEFNGAPVLDEAMDAFEKGACAEALDIVRSLRDRELSSTVRGSALSIEVACLELLNRRDDARDLIVGVMKKEGDDLAFIAAAAVCFEEMGVLHHAEVFLQNLTRLAPDNPEIWCQLASLYADGGRFEDAIEAYDGAIKHCPDWSDAYLGKGMMLLFAGDPDEARETVLKALELDEKNAGSWCLLAQLEWNVENREKAEKAYDCALACPDADKLNIYFEWGTSAAALGDSARAGSCAAAMQELEPGDWRTLMTTGAYQYTKEEHDAAEASFASAFEIALELHDLFALESTVSILFDFLADTGRENDAEHYVDRIFEEQAFTKAVMQILMAREGLNSNSALTYRVTLRSDTEPPVYRFYAVSAESSEQSELFAARFGRRCGEAVWEVHEIEQIGDPAQAPLGVYWRSDAMDRPPPQRVGAPTEQQRS
ncbi:MAG: tetratricopeptide repeat protein [Candidatus Hydrogenedentes bacterium]|nr:tetratricopeptide repeat protein [Candidatus Hydrogenedentota bacterium]